MAEAPLVGLIMGSRSDWETMRHAAETLDALGVPYEQRVVSAHRTPDLLFEYAGSAEERGLQVLDRRRGRCRAPARDGRGEDGAARARRSGRVEGAEGHRLAALDRADAGRGPGRDARDRAGRRRQRRTARGGDPRARDDAGIRDGSRAYRAAQTQSVLDAPDPAS